jgi:hypothetical protein
MKPNYVPDKFDCDLYEVTVPTRAARFSKTKPRFKRKRFRP